MFLISAFLILIWNGLTFVFLDTTLPVLEIFKENVRTYQYYKHHNHMWYKYVNQQMDTSISLSTLSLWQTNKEVFQKE